MGEFLIRFTVDVCEAAAGFRHLSTCLSLRDPLEENGNSGGGLAAPLRGSPPPERHFLSPAWQWGPGAWLPPLGGGIHSFTQPVYHQPAPRSPLSGAGISGRIRSGEGLGWSVECGSVVADFSRGRQA